MGVVTGDGLDFLGGHASAAGPRKPLSAEPELAAVDHGGGEIGLRLRGEEWRDEAEGVEGRKAKHSDGGADDDVLIHVDGVPCCVPRLEPSMIICEPSYGIGGRRR